MATVDFKKAILPTNATTGILGAYTNGTPDQKDLDVIQAAADFINGFNNIKEPTTVDISTLLYMGNYFATLWQQGGLPDYLPTIEYKKGAYVIDPLNRDNIYISKINNNLNNSLTNQNAWKNLSSTQNNVKYAVNFSNTTNGNPDIIEKISDTEIAFKIGGLYPSLIGTFSNGKTIEVDSIPNKTDINADGTYILGYENGSNEIIAVNLLLNSVNEGLALPVGVDGDYFTTINPLKSYKKVAGTWTEVEFFKIGELTKIGGVMGTPVPYALNGIFDALVGTAVQTVQTNLGTAYTNTFVFQGDSAMNYYGNYGSVESDGVQLTGIAWNTTKNTCSITVLLGSRSNSGDRLRILIKRSF